MTSQSIQMVRSPSAGRLVTDRSDRPMSRWISCVRPPTLPAEASRCVRVLVARGSMPYSAVTQPLPVLRRNCGTLSSTLAAQMTRVLPVSISTEPSACIRKFGVIVVGRSCCADRSSDRISGIYGFINHKGHQDHSFYPTQILDERTFEIDVARQRVDFLAVDEQLDR